MQKKTKLLDISLHLFDGATGAAAGDGGSSAQGMESALPKAETTKSRGSSRRAKSGEVTVVYGIQDDDSNANANNPAAEGNAEGNGNKSGVTVTSDTREAKREAFQALIDGEYRDEYAEVFQKAFNRRFSETKSMEQALSAQKPILDMLMQRYGIEDGDTGKLLSALENDNRYYEEAADEAGMTVEQFKAMKKLESENAQLKAMRQRQAADEAAQKRMNQWHSEAQQLKQLYPGFDFNKETQNRDFIDLLRRGISVKQAFELIHMDEITNAKSKAAAQTAGQQMVAKLGAKAARPIENGMSNNSSAIVKSDVHNLTAKDRAEIARRAGRGEKIRF